MRPQIPNPGDPIRASWFGELMDWIETDIVPRGDGRTTVVNGNIVSTLSGGGTTVTGLQPRWWIPVIGSRTVGGQVQDYVTITNPATVKAFGGWYNPVVGEVDLPSMEGGESSTIGVCFFYENTSTPIVYSTLTGWVDLFPVRLGHDFIALFTVKRTADGYAIVLNTPCYTGTVNLTGDPGEGYIWGFIPWFEEGQKGYKSTFQYIAAPGGVPQNSIFVPEAEFRNANKYIYITGGTYKSYLSLGLPQLPDGQLYASYRLSDTLVQARNWRFYLDWLLY